MNMTHIVAEPLFAAVEEFRHALHAEPRSGHSQWADGVHAALASLGEAIQEEVRAAEQDLKHVGEVNLDFQDAPVNERHIETMRRQLIKLGEQMHQLRADIRAAQIGADEVRRRGEECVNQVEKVRHAKNEFLLKTLNSNPGAGE
jgi:hypothetical protein